ncbi:Leucine-tRNA ligase, cytoplasmic [Coccomyxa sp. Obi]|nr:Leucine-tRNA ligase, cytoplasmic [Coccomyxa sp. Obi]
MAAPAEEGAHSTKRRDDLLSWQRQFQKIWEEEKIFEANAPAEGEEALEGKFFGNFPYPYMNGLLHLGHAFSLSKLEFASAYHRLCGKRVLFPQGFHCTGMPIKACADKLDYELKTYGVPPQFPAKEAEVEVVEEEAAAPKDPTKFAGKKSKATAKKGAGSTQWDILRSSGIPEAELPQFRHTDHWLKYFPPQAVRDIRAMGCGVDWRRSFITTDVNPYYDSFIRWQFEVLRRQGKIVKDKRYAVYSPKDGQPCADHDRASGEGVNPQEYTLIKMEAVELPGKLAALQGRGRVFLLAATLRPETMYGQTNCWALPDGDYGAFQGPGDEIYVMTARSALNLSWQDRMPVEGRPELLLALKGQDLIGVPLKAPNCPHERIYVLPLLTILTNKGTGVVTSVPSDAPDDYAALMDLKKKEPMRKKFGVKDEWVLPYEVIPIINIPGYGDRAAQTMCEKLKVQSQNDKEKLEEAKKEVYLKGFTQGTLIVGPHAGHLVSEVKQVIKDEMIAAGQAIVYSEPERQVMSRSGDMCVVALTDQWYINYGEDEWREATRACLERMELYHDDTRRGFEYTLGWLRQWACSRSFGLGTRLPWDPQFLIESLSDSTIYMAYYTVAHLLQNGDMYGQTGSVRPEDVTPEVWDFIFLDGPQPQHTAVSAEALQAMRREFQFWYPFDLRVSGKDLINNHLTFALYNHTAIWHSDPSKWPRAVRTNGHLLLNAEKMSKSTGNFKTLEQAILEYGADAMRIALADAGDAMDDANFEHQTANGAILRLTKEIVWLEETLQAAAAGDLRSGELNFADRVFKNEIDSAIQETRQAYDGMMFREALKAGWYDLHKARDTYRSFVQEEGMHKDLALRFAEVSTLLITPICPHTCDHIWRNILGRKGSALTAGFPVGGEPDFGIRWAAEYLVEEVTTLRKGIEKAEAPPKKKGGGQQAPPPKVVRADVYVAERYGGWQEVALNSLKAQFDAATKGFRGEMKDVQNAVTEAVKASGTAGALNDKALKGLVIPFAKLKADEATKGGLQVLDVKLPFDEAKLLRENAEYIKRKLNLQHLEIHAATEAAAAEQEKPRILDARPGTPIAIFSS